MRLEEPNEPTEMIVMAVAQNQRIKGRRIKAQQFQIVVERFRRVAEIDKDAPRLRSAERFDVERQSEFADKGSPRRPVRQDEAGALGHIPIMGFANRLPRDSIFRSWRLRWLGSI